MGAARWRVIKLQLQPNGSGLGGGDTLRWDERGVGRVVEGSILGEKGLNSQGGRSGVS